MNLEIKVGHLVYEVKPLTPLLADAESAMSVFSTSPETVIYIRADQPPAEQVRLLWHELIHVMWHAFNLPDRKLGEEDICLAIESPLAMVFRDNPHLGRVMTDAFGKAIPVVV